MYILISSMYLTQLLDFLNVYIPIRLLLNGVFNKEVGFSFKGQSKLR